MAVPAGRPGRPLDAKRIGERLRNIGLHPRPDRATALFALAAEFPAAVLARTLGISIPVAAEWQRASVGDWMNYAAEVSRRAVTKSGAPDPDVTPGRVRAVAAGSAAAGSSSGVTDGADGAGVLSADER
jgi:hypothetical protein